MKAVSCQESRLEVVDLPALEPAAGQAVINVTGCGICGSDLHARHHADAQADVLAEAGYTGFMRSDQRVVLGHEFCGHVAGYGPGTRKAIAPGAPVVALPLIRRDHSLHAIGLSEQAPGAYAEQVLVQESLMLELPNGLTPERAVLTEPLAVGWSSAADLSGSPSSACSRRRASARSWPAISPPAGGRSRARAAPTW
jgi:threonine dehydrogenase-like Zn-dependent dehydrogenase